MLEILLQAKGVYPVELEIKTKGKRDPIKGERKLLAESVH